MINEEIKKFEDRYGAPEFEAGQDSSLEKFKARKIKNQMKKYGIKPTDTDIDVADAVSRDVLSKVIAEDNDKIEEGVGSIIGKIASKMAKSSTKKMPKTDEVARLEAQKAIELEKQLNTGIKVGTMPLAVSGLTSDQNEKDSKALDVPPNNPEEDEDNENDQPDPNEELRIKIMQYLNPRIVKSHELKNYMTRANIKEEIIAKLNEIATSKLDLYKKAIAINAPVDLSEGKKENKQKLKNFLRQTGAHAYIKNVTQGSSMLKMGREVVQNPKISSQKAAALYRYLPNVKTPEAIRAEHDALHAAPVQEEVEQLDEASRNPNVMRQGRTKVVKARVRGGKVQRRKRLSAVKGYTIRGGKLKRMSAQERLRRKRGQRRGKIKRKAKQARALMRRKRSMRRRASLGLKE